MLFRLRTIANIVAKYKEVMLFIYNNNDLYYIEKLIYNYENVQFVNKNKNSNSKIDAAQNSIGLCSRSSFTETSRNLSGKQNY